MILLFYFAKPLGIAKSIEEDLQLIIHIYRYYFRRIMDGDLHHLIRLNDRNHFIYPHILQYQSYDDFYNTRSNDFRNAFYTFFDDIKKKFEIINLYELIDYAKV